MKKWFITVVSMIFVLGALLIPQSAKKVYAQEKSVTDYSYSITPILAPFNEYFFVKTDNPDPTSFRFVDKDTKYAEASYFGHATDFFGSEISVWADIDYENKNTGRVDGGYIFQCFSTDGGQITLQESSGSTSWNKKWTDTDIKLKLPVLKDRFDYLIDTYATKSDFFDNLDAVQTGLYSICLYDASYVRGELYRTLPFWYLSSSPHIDQLFYLQSPYSRKDNESLFAATIYPYKLHSSSFPSALATVAKRLEPSVVCEQNLSMHAYINVTYNGETKVYGGAGKIVGQGIDKEQIKQRFTFGENATGITMENLYQLLVDYASLEVTDDVPREDALTWEQVCNRVDGGAWVRLYSSYGDNEEGFAYLYKKNEGNNFNSEEVGGDGSEIYWGGDIGFISDAWFDGRYVDSWETYKPGAKFEDYPTGRIFLRNVTIPQITYRPKYISDSETGELCLSYTILQIEEVEKDAMFYHLSNDEGWCVGGAEIDKGCATYSLIQDFVKLGLIDEKYFDMVNLSLDEVKEMQVDRNTDVPIDDYFIYDGTTQPGVSIKEHTHQYYEKETKEPTCEEDGVKTSTCIVCGDSNTQPIDKLGHTDIIKETKATIDKDGSIRTVCETCDKELDRTVIPAIKTVKLEKTTFIYDGKSKKPNVIVKDKSGEVISSENYNVTYSGNKSVGEATVTVEFNNSYKGVVTKQFKISPKSTTISSLRMKQDSLEIRWKKQNTQISGYEIQYSTKSNFSAAKKVEISKDKTKTTIKNLNAKKKYYVRIRTFKKVKVNGKTKKITSQWGRGKVAF